MKTMTKVLSLLTAVVLVLGLTSCALFKNYDYVNEAITKTAGADALSIEMNTDVRVTAGEISEELSSDYTVTMKGLQTNAPAFLTETDVTLFGETVPATVYYENACFYVVTEEERVKLMSGDLIAKYDFADEWEKRNVTIPADVLKNAEETVNEDGTKTVTLSYGAEAFQSAYSHLITEWQEKLVKTYLGEYSESSLTLSNMNVTVVINETTGDLVSYTVSFDADLSSKTVDGENKPLSANIKYQTVYHAIGDAVVLNAPEGFADFEETDGLPLNAYEMIKDSVIGALALKDFQADVNLDVAFSMAGMNVEMPSKITLAVKNALTDEEEFNYTMTTSVLGMDIRRNAYYKDGFYYTDDQLNQIKYPKNSDTEKEYGYRSDIEMLLKTLPETVLEGVEVKRNPDGTKTATFTLDGGLIPRYYTAFATMVNELDIGELKWKSAEITLVWNRDKTLKSYIIDAKADTIVSERSTVLSVKYGIEYKETENVTLTIPENLDVYKTKAEMNGIVFDIVNTAVKNVLDANELSVEAYQIVEMEMGESYLYVEQDYTIAANKLKTLSPVYRYIVKSDLNGEAFEEDVYYENGYYYIDSEAYTSAFKIKEADAPSYNALASISKVLKTIPDFALEDVQIEGSNGAVCKLYWEMDPSKFKTVFPELAKVEVNGYQVSNVICREAIVAIQTDVNGKLLSYNLYADLSLTVSEPGASAQLDYFMNVGYEFDTSGAAVIITPPDNYQTYPLISG